MLLLLTARNHCFAVPLPESLGRRFKTDFVRVWTLLSPTWQTKQRLRRTALLYGTAVPYVFFVRRGTVVLISHSSNSRAMEPLSWEHGLCIVAV